MHIHLLYNDMELERMDGKIRIPNDCDAWKHIYTKWPKFLNEPRNMHLGLAIDGNPYKMKSTKWLTWQLLLVNYNIPPWLCIKKVHMILPVLIPGK